MTRRNLIADGAVAAVAFALSLGILATGGLDDVPDGRGVDVLGVLLVGLATLPLAGRRLAPLPVYAVVAAAMLAIWSLQYRTDIPFGPLIAIYTLGASYGGAGRWRRAGAILAVAGFVPAVAGTYLVVGYQLGEVLVPELVVFTLALAGVWLAGDRTRLRRERITALEERARRTEREAERERRVAAAEERTRIARELHDAAGHAINVILVQAGAARLLHERDPDGSQRAIATIEEVAGATIGDIDRIVRALREGDEPEPVPADPGAIEELLDSYRTGGLRVASDLRGRRRVLPRSVAWAAYRILQEAFTNAARHGTGSAEVTVEFGSEAVEVTVANPAAAGGAEHRAGHGIVGMRERASLLGGTLTAGRADGAFRLHARLPYAEAGAR